MRRFARVLIVALVAVATVAPLRAQKVEGHEEASLTRLGHFSAEMDRIRFWFINTGSKVKGNAMSMGRDAEDLPDTPSTRCCAVNVLRIEEHLNHLVDRWKDLEGCYQTEGNSNAQIQLNFVRADAGSLVRAYQNFRGAKQPALLLPAHEAMTKGFMLLEESAGKLDECGESVVR